METRRSIFASIAYLAGLGAMASVNPPPKRISLELTEQEARDAYAALTGESDRLRELAAKDELPQAKARAERYFKLADRIMGKLGG